MNTTLLKIFLSLSFIVLGEFAFSQSSLDTTYDPVTGTNGDGHNLCAFSKSRNVQVHQNPLTAKYNKFGYPIENDEGINPMSGQYVDSNNTEHCSKLSDSCYALWQEDPQNKSITILTQGCWDSSGDSNCGHSECIAFKKPPKALNNTKFCCCSGNLCNVNVTDGYVMPTPDFGQTPVWEPRNQLSYTTQIIVALVVFTVFGIAMVTLYIFAQRYCNNPKRSNESLHLMEAPPPMSPNFDLDSLKIQETVGCGRYGSVCRGLLNDRTVAVKIFRHQNRQYFLNERDIYNLPHMEHPSLLKYIGSDERTNTAEGRPEYLLVVSYSQDGCLQDYLRNRTIDWAHLCKMTISITRGLVHLHQEFGKGDKFKPCIAHRDLTSRNILVKDDGSCMLCDFGFAIRISGSKYFQNGEEQVAETTSLADVGTLRYMAPEILEGAVNLRDCESSLKQIDIYALGLVMWEVATRCSDLFQGVEVPEYKLPFELDVGARPNMEQMQVLVVKHKARPLFPDIWKDSNPAVRALKETIEDCWDQDAEARLTILCVEERLTELPVVWERYKAGLGLLDGVSPTFNPTTNIQRSTAQMKETDDAENVSDGLDQNDMFICPRERANSLSECTTDTLLSPSEPGTQNKNCETNNSVPIAKISVPLQPYQGRNPCLARNLMSEPQDEKLLSGNSLLDKPSKYTIDRNIRSFSDGDANIFDLPNLPNGMQSSLLVSSDLLNHSNRVCNPIPYVQNSANFATTIPKQLNVPGNGRNYNAKDLPNGKVDRRWGPLHIFDKKKSAREGIRAGLKSLLERKPCSISNGNLPEEQQPLKSSGTCCSPTSPPIDGKHGQTNPVNLLWTCNDVKETDHLVNTEVRISKPNNSVTTVRPLNNSFLKHAEEKEISKITEKNLANGHATILEIIKNENEGNKLLQDISAEQDLIIEKTKRPTTLPVHAYQNGHMDENDLVENSDYDAVKEVTKQIQESNGILMRRKGSGGKRKGVKRVKTPFEIKGRFSLYDDRIMSSQELPTANVCNGIQPQLDTTKFSASVPLDMNTLCLSQSSNTMPVDQQKAKELPETCKVTCRNGFTLPPTYQAHQNVVSLCDI